MKRKPIEVCAVWDHSTYQNVQTGIYVFSNTTLEELYELMKGYDARGENMPTRVEFVLKQFEENDEDE